MDMQNNEFAKITDILQNSPLKEFHSDNPSPTPPQAPQQPLQNQDIAQALNNVKYHIEIALNLLTQQDQTQPTIQAPAQQPNTNQQQPPTQNIHHIQPQQGTEIEGVFDGLHMIGADGKSYFVSPLYAAQFKIIEGDMMKLIITKLGAYIYNITNKTPRKQLSGTLILDPQTNMYTVTVDNHTYQIHKQTVSCAQAKPNNHINIIVPLDSPSTWATIA